jgi:hypothetical protein
MRWDNLRSAFGGQRDRTGDEVRNIESRPFTEREAGWVRDILQANDGWRNADVSRTHVVAEGPTAEGYSLLLEAPEPENPGVKSTQESVGNLWIETDDGSTINVQLTQLKGTLRELYVLFVDTKHPERKLPETWTEVSREAVPM